jgi:mono/diheme cytochrome c family protein
MKTHMKTLALAAAVSASFLVFVTASAQTPPAESGLLANSAYVKSCAKCHGKTAEGRHFGGPALISAKTAAASADDLRNVIANGKGHMPKFTGKLTPEEIDTLVKQIQALNK